MTDVLYRPDVLDRTDDDGARRTGARTALKIIDCDIHPSLRAREDLYPFLAKRWQEHMQTYGAHLRMPFTSTTPYPRSSPLICRRDAWPPSGGPPGSDLAFMRQQHLDPLDVEFGILQVLDLVISSQVRTWSSAPPCSAPSTSGRSSASASPSRGSGPRSWSARTTRRPRSRRSSAARPWASTSQVNISPRANEPLGRRSYWPIYEAAQAAGLPLGIHVGGYGGHAPTGGGWPSYYNEEHHSNAQSVAAQLTSLVIEGVPERFPKLKFVFIEGGFGWVPAITWRMDKHWQRFRGEVPHLKRPPSEYVREHFWFTTQPIEEPDNARHLRAVIEWIGIDRLLFSSDYPHWDFDDPRYRLQDAACRRAERLKIFNSQRARRLPVRLRPFD